MGRPLADSDLVFSHPNGSPLDSQVVSHASAKVLKQAGLPYSLSRLRHTHVTRLLKDGIRTYSYDTYIFILIWMIAKDRSPYWLDIVCNYF